MSTAEFDLSLTLESGQFFRWTREGDAFVVRSRDRRVRIRQVGTQLEVEGSDPDWVRLFFALDVSLAPLRWAARGDGVLLALIDRLAGLRVIRQDPWQCLLSYICATFSNIGRITKNVNDLARLYGRPLDCPGGGSEYGFPGPGGFEDHPKLSQVRLGYRAKYLWEAARTVTEPWLEGLRTKPYAEAKAALCGVPGVGDKVADCVLLFSLGFGEAFPVDVWVRRFVRRHYPGTRRLTDRRIGDWARRRYGQWAGWVQQYFFTAARSGTGPG